MLYAGLQCRVLEPVKLTPVKNALVPYMLVSSTPVIFACAGAGVVDGCSDCLGIVSAGVFAVVVDAGQDRLGPVRAGACVFNASYERLGPLRAGVRIVDAGQDRVGLVRAGVVAPVTIASVLHLLESTLVTVASMPYVLETTPVVIVSQPYVGPYGVLFVHLAELVDAH